MTKIIIEEGKPADVERIAHLLTFVQRIHAEAKPAWFKMPQSELFGVDSITQHFSEESSTYFLATLDGQDAGFTLIQDWERVENTFGFTLHHLLLDQICVHPDFRRRGVAKALLRRVRQEAELRGINGIQLSIWTFNEGSQAFFRSEGFEPFQTRYFQDLS